MQAGGQRCQAQLRQAWCMQRHTVPIQQHLSTAPPAAMQQVAAGGSAICIHARCAAPRHRRGMMQCDCHVPPLRSGQQPCGAVGFYSACMRMRVPFPHLRPSLAGTRHLPPPIPPELQRRERRQLQARGAAVDPTAAHVKQAQAAQAAQAARSACQAAHAVHLPQAIIATGRAGPGPHTRVCT